MRRDRLLTVTTIAVQAGRWLNVLAVALLFGAFIASFPAASLIDARLAHKYGAGAPIGAIVGFLRLVALFVLPVGVIVERLLRALQRILETVAADEPFTPVNAERLRTIGWMLLALQVVDLAYGALVLVARRLGIDYATWQPSITGWLAVLVAFVLVRVFATGTALHDDLTGTV